MKVSRAAKNLCNTHVRWVCQEGAAAFCKNKSHAQKILTPSTTNLTKPLLFTSHFPEPTLRRLLIFEKLQIKTSRYEFWKVKTFGCFENLDALIVQSETISAEKMQRVCVMSVVDRMSIFGEGIFLSKATQAKRLERIIIGKDDQKNTKTMKPTLAGQYDTSPAFKSSSLSVADVIYDNKALC